MEWFEIVKWWIVLEIIGFAAMPLTAWILKNLGNNNIYFSKILGLLFITYLSWLLNLFGFDYSTAIVLVSLLIVVAASMVIFSFKKYSFNRNELIRTEVLFTAAFLFFVILRAYQPDIHWTGGEKFMDMSFINMILRSGSFPPMDPWLSGEPMQYYYFGYLVVANIIKLSSVTTTVGFNLAVATMFALSANAAYGIGRELTQSGGFGLIIMAFVVIFGNPAGFVQLLVILFFPEYYSLFAVPDADLWTRLSTYNYWPASRVIPYTINEFPYFSFIQADVHAHMISIAFQLLMIGLLLSLLREGREVNIPLLAVITLLLGFMFPLNSWDYPTYAIAFMIVLLAWRIRVSANEERGFGFMNRILALGHRELIKTGGIGAAAVILSIMLYLPYHLGTNVPHSIKVVTYGQTQMVFYLGVYGIMLFFIILYALFSFYNVHHQNLKIIFAGLVIAVAAAYLTSIQILVIILPLIIMSLYSSIKENNPSIQFVHLLILLGALLSLFCEIFYIQDPFGISLPAYIRYNTVFKIYVQIWIIWALAAGLSLYQLWNRKGMSNKLNKGFALISICFILAAMSYPVFATYSRSGNFKGQTTLDGAAYMNQQYPNEYRAIMWLNNLSGTPVVLQSAEGAYGLNIRVTAFTGLPTVLGWAGHEKNWRNNARTIDERWSEVPMVYTSGDIDVVNKILDKYQVDYIYIGQVEEERYGVHDSRKVFVNNPDRFELVYFNPNVNIYNVVRSDV